MAAEAAKLKWQAAFNLDQGPGAQVIYYETLGNLMRNQSFQSQNSIRSLKTFSMASTQITVKLSVAES